MNKNERDFGPANILFSDDCAMKIVQSLNKLHIFGQDKYLHNVSSQNWAGLRSWWPLAAHYREAPITGGLGVWNSSRGKWGSGLLTQNIL